MNNLSTLGVYLNSLQQNLSALALAFKEVQRDMVVVKEDIKTLKEAPASAKPSGGDGQDGLEVRVSALEQSISGLQSIFSSLPAVPPPSVSLDPLDINGGGHNTPTSETPAEPNDGPSGLSDIEIIPKKEKKKPSKKKA